jgi:hypothetical protein
LRKGQVASQYCHGAVLSHIQQLSLGQTDILSDIGFKQVFSLAAGFQDELLGVVDGYGQVIVPIHEVSRLAHALIIYNNFGKRYGGEEMVLNEAEGVQYELLDKTELNEMAVMAGEAFACYEPVTTALGIPSEDFADFVRLLGPKMVQEELTVIARNQETKQIIGAMITDDFAIEPPEEILHLGYKFEPMWTVLDELDSRYKQKRNLTKGEYLHFFLLAVDHRQTGKNVARNLVQTCLENGIEKGYKTGVVEATGVVSQHIFREFGFVDRFEVLYKNFMFQGKQVFGSIEEHSGIILMDKALA